MRLHKVVVGRCWLDSVAVVVAVGKFGTAAQWPRLVVEAPSRLPSDKDADVAH